MSLFGSDSHSDRVRDGVGSLSLVGRWSVIHDMRVGGKVVGEIEKGCISAIVVILDASDEDELSWIPIVMEGEGTGRAAATGHGSRVLGVGIEDGRGNGIIIVLPCRRTGLRVLPEGDHMNVMFTL